MQLSFMSVVIFDEKPTQSKSNEVWDTLDHSGYARIVLLAKQNLARLMSP